MKDIESKARQALESLLRQVPSIKLLKTQSKSRSEPDKGIDFVVHVSVSGKRHKLVCEVKNNGQPRHVRIALLHLSRFVTHNAHDATPVLIAPYLSSETQKLCREEAINFLDLEGNARLIFDNVYIERQVASKPVVDRRELKSLFKPKSAQVLRVMLRNPRRAWRVVELAQEAKVSLGHVSNVRVGLLDREWAQLADEGLFLSKPNELLDAWREAYELPVGKRLTFYTTLHGKAFEEAAHRALQSNSEHAGLATLASFSAAQWLAPYGRSGMNYFYADSVGLEQLQSVLKLTSSVKGENVVITLVEDSAVLCDTIEPAPGIICTNLVQTYLDLTKAGERGREAAAHLRQERLTWQN